LREKLIYKFFGSCAGFFYGIQKSTDIFLFFCLQQFFLFRLKFLNLGFDIRDLFFNGLLRDPRGILITLLYNV
jgi:hypothetical protein